MSRYNLSRAAFRILAVLFVVAVPLFLVTGSVAWAVNDPGLYHRGFQKYHISALTGITDADLLQVAADIRRYFNSAEEPLVVRTRVFGAEQEIFNRREVAHMADVKGLVRGVYLFAGLSGVYLLGVAAGGFIRYGRPFAGTLARLFLWGGLLTLALVMAVGLFALVGFDALFLAFHRLSFSNDFWQLDPRRDYLIILFPQGFWFDATMRVALTAVGGAMMLAATSGAYLLYGYWKSSGSGESPPVAVEKASSSPATED